MMFANVPRFHLEHFGSCLQKSQVLGHLRTGHLQHPTVSDRTSSYFLDIGGFIAFFLAPGQDEEPRLEKYYLTVDRNVCLEMSKRVSF